MTSTLPHVRTRFAPAPSGSLHVGNARTALFAWLFARRHGGDFVLRVEDTDASRATTEHMVSTMDILHWLDLDWDEGPDIGGPHGPYRQSERYDRYREAAAQLVAAGASYPCYCTPEELDERRKAAIAAGKTPGYDGRCRTLTQAERDAFGAEGRKPVIRFQVPEGETVFEDLVRGEVRFDHEQIADFGIMRADDSPLYVLAAAVDDLAMKMTHVVRGEDLFAATPRQVMIFKALGATEVPQYAHLPLLVGADRQPLSKRHGHTALESFRDEGYLPEAMVNYLALLGWSYGDGLTEHFTVDDLLKRFDLSGVSRNPAAFDVDKLTAINGDYIRDLPPGDLATRLEPFLSRSGLPQDRTLLERIVPIIQERLQRLADAPPQIAFFWREPDINPASAERFLTAEFLPALEAYVAALEALTSWEAEPIKEAMFAVAEGLGLKKKLAFQPVRVAVMGSHIGPPLFESLEILGREKSLERIRRRLNALQV
jgi:glutamyl-tRNA synthetase